MSFFLSESSEIYRLIGRTTLVGKIAQGDKLSNYFTNQKIRI